MGMIGGIGGMSGGITGMTPGIVGMLGLSIISINV